MNDIAMHIEDDRSFAATAIIDDEDDDGNNWASTQIEVSVAPNSIKSLEMALEVLDHLYGAMRGRIVSVKKG